MYELKLYNVLKLEVEVVACIKYKIHRSLFLTIATYIFEVIKIAKLIFPITNNNLIFNCIFYVHVRTVSDIRSSSV